MALRLAKVNGGFLLGIPAEDLHLATLAIAITGTFVAGLSCLAGIWRGGLTEIRIFPDRMGMTFRGKELTPIISMGLLVAIHITDDGRQPRDQVDQSG